MDAVISTAAVFVPNLAECPAAVREALNERMDVVKFISIEYDEFHSMTVLRRAQSERVLFVLGSKCDQYESLVADALTQFPDNVGIYVELAVATQFSGLITTARHNGSAVWTEKSVGLLCPWLCYED